jgi:hypothetical protein
MAMGLRITHPSRALKGSNVKAFTAQPGRLHTDPVFEMHRIHIVGVNIKLNKIGELANFNRANLVLTAQDEGRINRLRAQSLIQTDPLFRTMQGAGLCGARDNRFQIAKR